jgi:hypothetical protein
MRVKPHAQIDAREILIGPPRKVVVTVLELHAPCQQKIF